MNEEIKDAVHSAIGAANHAQLSIMHKALQAECKRLQSCLEGKTDIANQLTDGMADMFEKNVALQEERDTLAVYCNELFRVLNQLNAQAERVLDFDIRNYHALKEASYAADNTLDKTPHQHLAAHDAEVAAKAVEDYVQRLIFDLDEVIGASNLIVEHKNHCVNQLRTKTK